MNAVEIMVLIETLWNVKVKEWKRQINNALGINRNIVECKDELPTSLNISGVGINRNIVECKDSWRRSNIFVWRRY